MKLTHIYISALVLFALSACGGGSDSKSESVSQKNNTPIANAGIDQTINPNTVATLTGNGTDADGDALTYQWTFISIPAGSNATLNSVSDASPTFTADIKGEYKAQLIVHDGTESSNADTVIIIANTQPVANAGSDQTFTVNSTVILDASSSVDADNDKLNYEWLLTAKPEASTAELIGADTQSPQIIIDAEGEYSAQLIVNDGLVDSLPSSVKIQATPPEQAFVEYCVSNANEFTAALNEAATNQQNDYIKLVAGDYLGNFKIIHPDESDVEGDIIIEGGYSSTCSNLTNKSEITVIDGNDTDAGIVLIYDIKQQDDLLPSEYGISIKNMTFTNGNNSTSGGGGLAILANVNVLIDSVHFIDNKVTAVATQSDIGGGGGGLAVSTLGAVKVTSSEIIDNYVQEGTWGNESGGGFELNGFLGAELSNSVVKGNKARGMSAGALTTRGRLSTAGDGNIVLANNIIQSNISTDGDNGNSAVYFTSSNTAYIFGNLIADNISYNYNRDGFSIGNAALASDVNRFALPAYYYIENNTIINNVTYFNASVNYYTESMALDIGWMFDEFHLIIQNNIFSGNVRKEKTTGEEWEQNIALENDYDDNFISSAVTWNNNSYPIGTVSTEVSIEMSGDIDFLPSYLDGNYQLLPASPLIDIGVEVNFDTNIDANGNNRKVGTSIDLGAFEHQGQ